MLVMSALGPSLQGLLDRHAAKSGSARFSAPTVLSLGSGVLACLRGLHAAGYVHNDLKPANILLGAVNSSEERALHLVDFGLATRRAEASPAASPPADARTAELEVLAELEESSEEGVAEEGSSVAQVGTALFASVAAHDGRATRAVDDLESLVYVLAFLSTGTLPWRDTGHDAAADCKRRVLIEGCDGLLAAVDGSRGDDRDDGPFEVAKALRALWAHVQAGHADGRDVAYDVCLDALASPGSTPYDWEAVQPD